MDLFAYPPSGIAEGKTDTSRSAAREKIAPVAQTIRSRIAEVMRTGAQVTADEMAAHLHLDILAVRPRFTELKMFSMIEDTGRRRRNRKGNRQIVWTWRAGVA